LFALFGTASLAFGGADASGRAKITGIDHVAFYTTAPEAVTRLYHGVLGLAAANPIEMGETLRYMVGKQWVGYSTAPSPQSLDRMDHVAFATGDIAALQDYLKKKGVTVPESIETRPDGSRSFRMKDPEGHPIEFIERAKVGSQAKPDAEAVSRRLIHAGFVVRNRGVEDAFYRDILGFHVYWFGGMKAGQIDWCAMQVPEGTDWLEYMLNVPGRPNRKLMGVMNHISLGVVNMKQAAAKLESHGWQPHGDEQAQLGKDGKWQLNLYDPDLTRVELMEFLPVEKPCCSDFQGPQPGPDR
jgi:catechol 2,3-dioxygenase-like lactoylglutathione lyase family enzyme